MTDATQGTPNGRELAGGKLHYDEPSPGVARLRIENTQKRGALDHEILDSIASVVPTIDARCLVLTGTGEVFSAGYDIRGLDGTNAEFAVEAEKLVAHPFTEAIEAIEAFPFPTIAALNGHAIGGGLEVAISCDLRIAVDSARLGMPPAKLGLVYSHHGLRRFIQTIGPAHTRELFFTGHNITAERAERIGLVNEVLDRDALSQRSLELAAAIAENAPLSLSGNKHVINQLLNSHSLTDEVESELIELRRRCFTSDDFREGVRAFEEKRKPRWQGK